MKNLTKILFAVAALAVGFSCTTDTTEDLSPAVKGGGFELAISLEESRTQLGEKADGVYPLHWSVGDKVAVNGVTSAEAQISAANKAVATFVFDSELVRPYNLVYPAPAEGVTAVAEGCYPVTFPASQSYTAGTFASGTAPMYGYAAAPAEGEEAAPIAIHHLSGILCLSVKGDKTLTSMTVTAEGAIAGNFDVNCETGALTAHEDAANTITLSFGEGLALGAEATPIYVAVPAGEHGIYTITLFTNEAENNAMITRFNSDNHPVKAGTVKEFGEITFIANATAEPVSGELVIENEADLVRLANLSEVGLLGAVTSVRVAATLDMSKVEGWHGIDRFPAITFDGGSDKGYEIKGLTAPLFQTVNGAATIKNVKLTGVNMNSADHKHFGALACDIICETKDAKVVLNCSVAGNIIIENQNITLNSDDKDVASALCFGGLVGYIQGGTIEECTNYATVTVKQLASLGNTVTTLPAIGGVVGSAYAITLAEATDATAAEIASANVVNCYNRGVVKYEDNAEAFLYRSFVGGVIGYFGGNFVGNITNCDNFADVYMGATVSGSSGANYATCLGGIAGRIANGVVEGCDNSAEVTFNGRGITIAIGGAFGYASNSIQTNCHNTGKVEITKETRLLGIMAGGVAGGLYNPNDGAVGYSDNLTNNAPLKVLCSTDETNIKNGAYYYRIGGVVAFGRQKTTNCDNLENGDITLAGKWIHMSSEERSLNIGGVIGYKTKGAVDLCDNYGDINIDTDITINSTNTAVIAAQILNIGGVVSDSSYSLTNSDNYGNITFSGSFTGERVCFGGVLGNGISNNVHPGAGAVNSGNITITEDAEMILSKDIFLGGCAGITEAGAIDGMTNNGNITIKGKFYQWVTTTTNAETGEVTESKAGGNVRLGGVAGYFTSPHKNLVNNGKIEFTSTCFIEGSPQIGGVVGDIYSKTTTNVYDTYTNNGAIIFNANNKATLHLGGITSDPYCATMQNMTNNGAISLNGVFDGPIKIGGCFGFHDKELVTFLNCTNNAPISLVGEYNSATALYVGGVCCSIQGKGPHKVVTNTEKGDILIDLTKCVPNIAISGITNRFQDNSEDVVNHGDITIKGNYDGSAYIAGFCYTSNNYTRPRHGNTGNITIDAKLQGALVVGVMYSYGKYGKTFTDCYNTGDITVTENSEVGASVYIGGMIGYFDSSSATYSYTNCYNSGNISFKGKSGHSTEAISATAFNQEHVVCLGGLVAQSRNNSTKLMNITNGFKNSGKIEFTGNNVSGSVYIGGVAGDMLTSTASWTGDIVNTGEIVCTGTAKNLRYAGGIFGKTAVGVANGVVYCDMNAPGVINSGMVMGSERSSSSLATNCKVGGSIMTTALGEDSDGNSVEQHTKVDISAENFFNYIYGGDYTWPDTNYDGCTFLSVAPASVQ